MKPEDQQIIYDRLLRGIHFPKLAAVTSKPESQLRGEASSLVAEMLAQHPRIVAATQHGWHLLNRRWGPGSWMLEVIYPLAFTSELYIDNEKVMEAVKVGLIDSEGEVVSPPPVCPECHSPTPLKRFQEEVGEWSAATFKEQNPASKIEHLRREVEELAKAPDDPGELADCLILLCGIAELAGVDLLAATQAKMEVNRAREWGEPDATGVCSHI